MPLPQVILGAVALVVILALLLWLLKSPPQMPYQRREEFLSPAEFLFFRALEQAVGDDFYIFAKVRIGDLLCVTEGTENARGWFARIGQKHVDFLLADRENVRPVLVIELDDSSHQRTDRQQRDTFVDAALQAAGLPILRIPCAAEYSVEQLTDQIKAGAR